MCILYIYKFVNIYLYMELYHSSLLLLSPRLHNRRVLLLHAYIYFAGYLLPLFPLLIRSSFVHSFIRLASICSNSSRSNWFVLFEHLQLLLYFLFFQHILINFFTFWIFFFLICIYLFYFFFFVLFFVLFSNSL